MKRTLLMKIDVETLYPFIRKKSPRHIDPKIPSHGGEPGGAGSYIYQSHGKFWAYFIKVFFLMEI